MKKKPIKQNQKIVSCFICDGAHLTRRNRFYCSSPGCKLVYHISCAGLEELNRQRVWTCFLCQIQEAKEREKETKGDSYSSNTAFASNSKLFLELLSSYDETGLFQLPVPDTVENYYKYVHQPMDFQTMRSKLFKNDKEEYNVKKVYEDFEILCNNCLSFNPKQSYFWKEGLRLKKLGTGLYRVLQKINVLEAPTCVTTEEAPRPLPSPKPKQCTFLAPFTNYEAVKAGDWITTPLEVRPYSEVSSYVPVLDDNLIMEKLKTNKRGHCHYEYCCSTINLLEASCSPSTSELVCPDYIKGVECEEGLCTCGINCCNRSISSGKRLKLALEFNATTGGDLAKTNTWGLDPYTRKNVFLTLVEYELCKRPRRFCFLPLSGIKPSTQRNAIAKTAV
jgi:hypothetical protein